MTPLVRDTVDVGARVKALREAKGLEQVELAEAADLSRAYISRLENGGILNPKVYDLARVATVLETSVAQLIEPPPASNERLRAELASILGDGNAELLEAVVDEIGPWPPADQRFVVELFRSQVFNWPGRPVRPLPQA